MSISIEKSFKISKEGTSIELNTEEQKELYKALKEIYEAKVEPFDYSKIWKPTIVPYTVPPITSEGLPTTITSEGISIKTPQPSVSFSSSSVVNSEGELQ